MPMFLKAAVLSFLRYMMNSPRQNSVHGSFHSVDALRMDDFGAVPFTELVVQSIAPRESQQPQPVELDPFGAAPFPSKQ